MPPPRKDDRVRLGVIGAAHGVRGAVRVKSDTAEPLSIGRYGPLALADGSRILFTSLRPLKGGMLVATIEGITTRDAAERLVNRELFVARAALGEPGSEDEFLHADLIGLRAETAEGAPFGTIIAVHDFGAGDLLDIAPAAGGASLLIPFTRACVPVVDIAGGRVVIVPPAETGEPEPGA